MWIFFSALFYFDLTGQRRHFNEELWLSCISLFSSMGFRNVYQCQSKHRAYRFKGTILFWLNHPKWQPRVASPPFMTFPSNLWKGGSSLGEHLMSGQYLMRNICLSQQCFVDILSVRVTFLYLLMGQDFCIVQGSWVPIWMGYLLVIGSGT